MSVTPRSIQHGVPGGQGVSRVTIVPAPPLPPENGGSLLGILNSVGSVLPASDSDGVFHGYTPGRHAGRGGYRRGARAVLAGRVSRPDAAGAPGRAGPGRPRGAVDPQPG